MRSPIQILGLTVAIALLAALPAAAHPLGNFTINHLTKFAVEPHRVDVRYVLDMAEIPSFALMRQRDPNGRMSTLQLRSWSHDELAVVLPQLDLRIDGAPVTLVADRDAARTRPGAGGLPLLYWVADLHVPLAAGAHTLSYADKTFAGRLGWKDVIVSPQTEPTHELLAYPSALIGSPRDTTTIAGSLSARGAFSARPMASATSANVGSAPSAARSNQLSDMLARGTNSPYFVLLTLLVAVALGALHALEPGHGKTLLAVSLVGARASVSQAAILAGSLTVAHTVGVLALGVAIIALKGYFVPESIYPWITLVSGVIIAIIGARAVARQVMARQPFAHAHSHGHAHAHGHDHVHEHHPHAHDHGHRHAHPHGHEHSHDDEAHARAHAIVGSTPLRFGPTVWAAMSGGVAPCPAALVVLFAAIAQNVLAYGLVVIVFFSFGLAATLTALGIGVVRGASWISRRRELDRVVRYGPLVSAVVIAVIGSVMVGQGLVQQGMPVSAPLVTALVALGIAGYAFSHPLHGARSVQTA
jgi:nickel/cobalt transporter (NicO) family protein